MALANMIKEQHSLKISLTRKNGFWNIEAKSNGIIKSTTSEKFPSENELLTLLLGIEKEILAA